MTNHENSSILPDMLFGGTASDIRTRVVLQNEVSHTLTTPGMAGKVGLIGAIPSKVKAVKAVTSYPEFLKAFDIADTADNSTANGVKAAQYLFMNNFPTVAGATSVTCVNTMTTYTKENALTIEMLSSSNELKDSIQKRLEEIEYELATLTAIPSNNRTQAQKDKITALNSEKTSLNNQLEDITNLNEFYNSENGPNVAMDTIFTAEKLERALNKLADEDIDLLFIAEDLWDCVYSGTSGNQKLHGEPINNIGQVYEHILDFIDNKFSNHQPLSLVGWIKTDPALSVEDYAWFETNHRNGTKIINVFGGNENGTDLTVETNDQGRFVFPPLLQGENNKGNWGAYQIAQLFTKEKNELSTCGLFFQSATIMKNGKEEKISPMEFAAHMCGWIAGMNVGQDLTYQTIPGIVGLGGDDEEDFEIFFGPGDAGEIINNFGIQVMKPKNRLDKTYYINNSVTPSGWHTNHIRSVNYLLKRFAFEAGLGINNYTSNIAIFRTSLENISREVQQEVDLIRSVAIGNIEVINNYHIYVPIDIVLAGVVTKISVGVSMVLDETGEYGSTKTTTGYNFYY